MRPGTYGLNLYRGDTYAWKFVLYQDSALPPNPSDLTGVTAKAEIRTAPLGTLLVTLGVTITQPNIVLVKLTTPMWMGLNTSTAAWDLQLTYPDTDNTVLTIINGPVSITPDVTDTVPAVTRALASRRVMVGG
jgi:hypothetical protein